MAEILNEAEEIVRTIEDNGSTTIGRNDLKIRDQRISRVQVLLDYSNGSLTLTLQGMNPIFVTDRHGKTVKLQKGSTVTLHDGDRFHLLMDEHPFYVRLSGSSKKNKKEENKPSIQNKKRLLEREDDEEASIQSKKKKDNPSPSLSHEPLKKRKNGEESDFKLQLEEEEEYKHLLRTTNSNFKRNRTAEDEKLARQLEEKEEEMERNRKRRTEEDAELAKRQQKEEKEQAQGEEDGEQGWRDVVSIGSKSKKKKTTSKAKKSSKGTKAITLTEADDPSENSGIDDDDEYVPKHQDDLEDTNLPPPILTRARAKIRRVCRYGAACYRRNPDHLAKFYHPPKNDESDSSASSNVEV